MFLCKSSFLVLVLWIQILLLQTRTVVAFPRHFHTLSRNSLSSHSLHVSAKFEVDNCKFYKTLVKSSVEEGDALAIHKIATSYINFKVKKYQQSNSLSSINSKVIIEVLKSILPPLSTNEILNEISDMEGILASDSMNIQDEGTVAGLILKNTFWNKVDVIVLLELIYLECLYHYYHENGEVILEDLDYAELKNQLTWSGSDIPTLTSKEALFVTALANSRKGNPIISNDEYEAIKSQLKADNSWVVNRFADGLEKLGLDTLLGYIHRSF